MVEAVRSVTTEARSRVSEATGGGNTYRFQGVRVLEQSKRAEREQDGREGGLAGAHDEVGWCAS